MKWTLNGTEIDTLKFLVDQDKGVCISAVSKEIDISLPWASECVSHMNELGLIDTFRKGNRTYVTIAKNDLGSTFKKLAIENRNLNLKRTLGGSSLSILPYLLENGIKMKDVSRWSSLSYRTVMDHMNRWNRMGIAYRNESGFCKINPRMRDLITFLDRFKEHRDRALLEEISPGAVIMWQRWEEVLFSSNVPIEQDHIYLAGPTRLSTMGFDINAGRNYFMFSRRLDSISVEEAIVQSILIDPVNPRPISIFKKAMASNELNRKIILGLAEKYGMEIDLEKMVV